MRLNQLASSNCAHWTDVFRKNMPSIKLSFSKLGPGSEPLLTNLFEHYGHDMSEWLDIDTNPDGRYAFDTSKFWTESYAVHLAKSGDSIAGFAIVGSASTWLGGDSSAHDVSEFFVLRKFRRAGVGRQLAEFIWNAHPGEWLVRVIEANRPAVAFWRGVVAIYTNGAYTDERVLDNNRHWRFLRFGVRSAK